jgi:hypothetical protein
MIKVAVSVIITAIAMYKIVFFERRKNPREELSRFITVIIVLVLFDTHFVLACVGH